MNKYVTGSLIGAALMLGTLSAPASAEGDGGNSHAAHSCQQGGWEHLKRDDSTRFANTGDCVSYAARGGELGTIEPRITISFTPTGDPSFCLVHVSLIDLDPDTAYTAENWIQWQYGEEFFGTTNVTTDASGAATYTPYSFLRDGVNGPRWAQARIGSLMSEWTTITC